MNEKYREILNTPHHRSAKHPHMPVKDRAAQFASFAALTGHSAAVAEEARLVDSKIELNDEQIADLNVKFQYICDNINDCPQLTVTYFVPDQYKQGGAYLSVCCKFKKIDVVNRVITTTQNQEIKIDDILEIVI